VGFFGARRGIFALHRWRITLVRSAHCGNACGSVALGLRETCLWQLSLVPFKSLFVYKINKKFYPNK